MIKEILVDTKPGETRAAILEDGELVELHIESAGDIKLIGNIYRGRVERVLPGMQCAFVDIGVDKNAYLSAGDMKSHKRSEASDSTWKDRLPVKVENMAKQGQEITVQVVKEAIGTKGPKVTMDITLPGNLTVLMPYSSGVGVSKKIDDKTERERLVRIADELCPEGMGLIVRTAAEGVETHLIEKDIYYQLKTWEVIKLNEQKGHIPRCIYQEPGIVQKLARDSINSGIQRFVLNNHLVFENLLELFNEVAPEMKTKVEFFYKDYDLFKFYNVDVSIKEALSRKVWLKCGGYLIFDHTEALTVIDVNTGKYVGRNNPDETIFKTNYEAALAIARQIRLRDISGIILVDFIDMKGNLHKEKILTALKEACRRHSTKVVVVGMTGLGLVEMTRKKIRNTLQHTLTLSCPMCNGTGRVLKKTF